MKILLFKLSTCSPCKAMSKTLSNMNLNFEEMVIDDSDIADALADKYNVSAVPTIIVVGDNEEELSRISGVRSKEYIEEQLKEFGYDRN